MSQDGTIRVYRDDNAIGVVLLGTQFGTQFYNELQAVGNSATDTVTIVNNSKTIDNSTLIGLNSALANEENDEYLVAQNKPFTLFRDFNGDALGSTLAQTVNELNILFTNTGGPDGPPVITSPTDVEAKQGEPFYYQATADFGVAYYWSDLPAGVMVDNTDQRNLLGTPTEVKVNATGLEVANYFGSTTATITITVAAGFINTKSVLFNRFQYLNNNAVTTASPFYRASNSTGTPWTVAFWFRQPSITRTNNQTVFAFGSSINRVLMQYRGRNQQLRFFYGGFGGELQMTLPAISDTDWHQCVVTYNGGTTNGSQGFNRFVFYIDGSSVSTNNNLVSGGFTGSIPADLFRIGQTTAAQFRTLRYGYKVDEFAVWDSVENAATLWNGGKSQDLAPLNPNSWYRMGDGDTYPTLADSGSDGFDLTMTNMTPANIINDAPPSV